MAARLSLVFCIGAILATCALLDPSPRGFTIHEVRNPPYRARAALTFAHARYLLGEPIVPEYRVTNVGAVPFPASWGGDYRGAPRHIRFLVTATDAAGRACLDPFPDPWCEGGLGMDGSLAPGEHWAEPVCLNQHVRFERPGMYQVAVWHDLGWKQTPPGPDPRWAEATIEIVEPTPAEARALVAEAVRCLEVSQLQYRGKVTADWSSMSYPVYLPFLTGYADRHLDSVLTALGEMPTPEATAAMFRLGGNDPDGAAAVLKQLNDRLPVPGLDDPTGKSLRYVVDADRRRRLRDLAWRPEHAPPARQLAAVALGGKELEGLRAAAFTLELIGTADDLPVLTAALDRLLRPLGTAESEQIQRPWTCDTLVRAMAELARRGARPAAPRTPGEAVAFAAALRSAPAFRPAGWEAARLGLFRHPVAYVREQALVDLPDPVPDALREPAVAALADPDRPVRKAAFRIVGRARWPDAVARVLAAVRAAADAEELGDAAAAAHGLGLRSDLIRIYADRLDDPRVGRECLGALHLILAGGRIELMESVPPDRLKACKGRWQQFLAEHGSRLSDGGRIPIDDPVITPDLFPGYRFIRGESNWVVTSRREPGPRK